MKSGMKEGRRGFRRGDVLFSMKRAVFMIYIGLGIVSDTSDFQVYTTTSILGSGE